MKYLLSILVFSCLSFTAKAQSIAPCAVSVSGEPTCAAFLYLMQKFSLNAGETYQCVLDFSICASGTSYINNWFLSVSEFRKSNSDLARDVSLDLIDQSTGQSVNLESMGGFHNSAAQIYINRVPDNLKAIVSVKRSASKSRTSKSYGLSSAGAASGR